MEQPKLYQRKPTQVQAIQWTGENVSALTRFGATVSHDPTGETLALFVNANSSWVALEIGEWIAKDEMGYYPIKDEQFKRIYDEANSTS